MVPDGYIEHWHKKYSSFRVYSISEENTVREDIIGVYYFSDQFRNNEIKNQHCLPFALPETYRENNQWVHEIKSEIYLLYEENYQIWLLIAEDKIIFFGHQISNQLQLHDFRGNRTPYFIVPHHDTNVKIHPFSVRVSGTVKLDGIYLREPFPRHGKVSYYHSIYTFRIHWSWRRLAWELSIASRPGCVEVYARSFHGTESPISNLWRRESLLGLEFEVKEYFISFNSHRLGNVYLKPFKINHALQKFNPEIYLEMGNFAKFLLAYTSIDKIPEDHHKPIRQYEEIRISSGLNSKDISLFLLTISKLCSNVSGIIAEFVGDQVVYLNIDHKRKVRITDFWGMKDFCETYKIDLPKYISHIGKLIGLSKSVIQGIGKRRNWVTL